MDKSELRREMKARLSALSGEERRRASEKICMALSSLPEFIAAKKAFLFYPLKSEPDILPLVKFCEEGGKIVLKDDKAIKATYEDVKTLLTGLKATVTEE